MPRFSVWTQTVLTKVTSLASDDAFALATNTPEAKAIERDALIADIASDVLDELPLTTDGDLLTQAAGARARITRADLAADIATDTAFTGAFADIASEIPTGGAAGQVLVKSSGTDYDTAWDDNFTLLSSIQSSGTGSAETTANSSTFVLVATTGFPFTFIAPESGIVFVEGSILWRNSSIAGLGGIIVRLDENGTTVTDSSSFLGNSGGVNVFIRSQYLKRFTGLTPGASYTWRWEFNNGGSGTTGWWYGGVSNWFTARIVG
jgi:hypothetical protein